MTFVTTIHTSDVMYICMFRSRRGGRRVCYTIHTSDAMYTCVFKSTRGGRRVCYTIHTSAVMYTCMFRSRRGRRACYTIHTSDVMYTCVFRSTREGRRVCYTIHISALMYVLLHVCLEVRGEEGEVWKFSDPSGSLLVLNLLRPGRIRSFAPTTCLFSQRKQPRLTFSARASNLNLPFKTYLRQCLAVH